MDNGLFLPLAMRMADACKRVLYWTEYEEGFSSIRKGCLGDGFERIERCRDIWQAKKDVDLFCFPDIEHSGMQAELIAQGYPVWGSRMGDSLELNREKFLRVLASLGLDVPPHTVVVGLTGLSNHVKELEDQYIKISRWRGDLETCHWRSWKLDSGILDAWAVKFGPLKELIRFLVFPAIETDLEIGGDTYCVDGQWPRVMLNGLEWKDKSYFGVVTPRSEMPEQLQEILEAFGPVLGEYRYRNEFSSEVRVKDDSAYFIDPTCRGGLPSTGSQLMLWKNFPEIVWAGANGELLEPEYDDAFSMECVLTTKCEKGQWSTVEIPHELEPWVKLSCCCYTDGLYCFPPSEHHGEEIGWLVATGKTPQETLDTMKEHAAMLPDGVCANVESLADILKEVESAEEQGIPITDQPVPEPETVIEKT